MIEIGLGFYVLVEQSIEYRVVYKCVYCVLELGTLHKEDISFTTRNL